MSRISNEIDLAARVLQLVDDGVEAEVVVERRHCR